MEVNFISKGENLRAIRTNGLLVRTPESEIQAIPAQITDQPSEIGIVDYLFCCTKSYDLESNIEQLKPVIGEKTVIIPFLNGLDNTQRIQQMLPEHTVWKGCVYIGSRIEAPGIINRFSTDERLFFGSEESEREPQQKLLSILLVAGINAFNPEDMETRLWKKFFFISTAATITSYYNLPISEVIRLHKDTFVKLGEELEQIARTKGIRLPEQIVTYSIESRNMMPTGATTSIHQDFIKGGANELETLTGYVVRLAEQEQIEIPVYRCMYNALKTSLYR